MATNQYGTLDHDAREIENDLIDPDDRKLAVCRFRKIEAI